MDRREFCLTPLRLAPLTLLPLATILDACAHAQSTAQAATQSVTPANGESIVTVDKTAFANGTTTIMVDGPASVGAPIAVRHNGDSFVALSMRCPHRGCKVGDAGDHFACRCHGAQFSATGELLRGPAKTGLTRFEITSDADHLYVHVPQAQDATPQPTSQSAS